jgi:hypothetical protein
MLLAALAERGLAGLTIEDLGKLNPPDEFETELRIMAEVRGYFQVAFKVRIEVSPLGLATFSKYITNPTALIFFSQKIVDVIPELIDLTFIKATAKDLQPFLYKILVLVRPMQILGSPNS